MYSFKDISIKFQKILLGVITKSINYNFVYSKVNSYLSEDALWYNYVIPHLNDLSIEQVNNIKKILANGDVAFYVNEHLCSSYGHILSDFKLIGTDSYLTLTKKSLVKPLKIYDNFEVSTKYNLDEVVNLLTECFDEWEGERKYCELFENAKTNGLEDRLFETFVIYDNKTSRIVASAAIVIDKSLGLAYLHNAGVHKDYRRMGLHTELINTRINYGVRNGIYKFLAITEENSASYNSFIKQGFEFYDKFYFYQLKN